MDTVDLEQLPDSCEREGALVLWLSCEDQIDVWEMFSDTSYLSAILDRQELQVAAAIDLRTKKAESFLAAADTGLLAKKDKNPKIVVMSLTFETKDFNKEDMVWQQYHLCIDVAEHQILGGKHFLIFGSESGKILVVTKRWIFHNLGNLSRPLESIPATRERVVFTEWQVRTVLGECISKAKVIPARAPQKRQHALISDFLDLAN